MQDIEKSPVFFEKCVICAFDSIPMPPCAGGRVNKLEWPNLEKTN